MFIKTERRAWRARMLLLHLGFASLVCAVLLAFHHWYIHSSKPPPDGVGNPCLLQGKDFCVFTRGTHETPILLLLLLGFGLIYADYVTDVPA